MSSSPHFGTGQTHLNSDAKIADEGRPQGAPLPIVFSRRYALGRAPTRGAPTNCLLSALWPGEGTHKGRPYRLSFLGVMAGGGHPQGAPLPIVFSRRYALGRAPTRGAPTDCLFSALWPGEGAHKGRPYRLPWRYEGTHKGRPYRLSSLGVMAWGGHPQGAPLPIVFSRRYALGRAPTRGAPTDCLFSALCPGEGTHKGRPYRLSFLGVMPWGGHPQGAPLPIVFSRRYGPGEGAHKGRPYRLSSLGVMPWGGRPQGAPLPIVFSRRYGPQGAPLPIVFSRRYGPGEGTHKGRPYRLSSLLWPWGGRPQGAPLPIVFSRRYGLGRAPTRGAPTDCLSGYALGRAPTRGAPTDCLLSALWPWGGRPQGAPLPIVFSRRYGLGRAPTRGAPTDCLFSALWPWGGHPQGAPLPIRYALGRAPTRGAPTRFAMPWGGHPQGAPLPDSLCPGEGAHKGRPYPIQAASRGFVPI